jgi:WhiB family redox-sensing transcriptional regulator
MAKAESWSSERWLPIPGRVTVCRRNGCSEPAVDDIRRLCALHGQWQPKRLKHDDRPTDKQAKRAWFVEALTSPAWAVQAACRARPDLDFFPTGNSDGAASVQAQKAALAVCAVCPVQAECLEAGLHERHGIWGGTSERERVRLRRFREGHAAYVQKNPLASGLPTAISIFFRTERASLRGPLTSSTRLVACAPTALGLDRAHVP